MSLGLATHGYICGRRPVWQGAIVDVDAVVDPGDLLVAVALPDGDAISVTIDPPPALDITVDAESVSVDVVTVSDVSVTVERDCS